MIPLWTIVLLVYALTVAAFRAHPVQRDVLLVGVTLFWVLVVLVNHETQVDFYTHIQRALDPSSSSFPSVQEQTPIALKGKPRVNLVVQGSGAGIVAMTGALYALRHDNFTKRLKRLAGVSSGALLVYMLALGYTEDELVRIVYHLDLDAAMRASSWIAVIRNLWSAYGMTANDRLRALIRALERHKNVPDGYTFRQLKESRDIELYVNSVNVNRSRTDTFSVADFPDLPIVDALLASMAFPYLFTPVAIKNELYIDGTFGVNFPIFLFGNQLDETIGLKPGTVYTKRDTQMQYPNYSIDSVKSYSSSLLRNHMLQLDRLYLAKNSAFWDHVILVPFNYDPFRYTYDTATKLKMLQTAYNETYKQIDKQRQSGRFESIRLPPAVASAMRSIRALQLDPVDAVAP